MTVFVINGELCCNTPAKPSLDSAPQLLASNNTTADSLKSRTDLQVLGAGVGVLGGVKAVGSEGRVLGVWGVKGEQICVWRFGAEFDWVAQITKGYKYELLK